MKCRPAATPNFIHIDLSYFNRYAMPSDASHIFSALLTTNCEIKYPDKLISVGKKPGPITALTLEPTKTINLLREQRIPIPIRNELLIFKTAQGQMMLIPISRKAVA